MLWETFRVEVHAFVEYLSGTGHKGTDFPTTKALHSQYELCFLLPRCYFIVKSTPQELSYLLS